jgi:phosphatidylglycerophosphate synthase
MNILDWCRSLVRRLMKVIARGLHQLSGGRLTPNMITISALLAHIPIAYLIAYEKNELAAALLLVFGLFDALDGELARLQKRSSDAGMVLDASTDRFKEVLLYSGAAYALASGLHPKQAVWAVAACGASLCVSYVKAKGETAIKDRQLNSLEVNRLFADGLLRFEIRMALLIIGLAIDQLALVLIAITIGATLTAIGRLWRITRRLGRV